MFNKQCVQYMLVSPPCWSGAGGLRRKDQILGVSQFSLLGPRVPPTPTLFPPLPQGWGLFCVLPSTSSF